MKGTPAAVLKEESIYSFSAAARLFDEIFAQSSRLAVVPVD
jgi:hypothetical protein